VSGVTIRRLNHAVLFVRDADVSARFYKSVLGFRDVFEMGGARFLKAEGSDNDHDLGLFTVGSEAAASAAGRGSVGLYHLAWEVETLGALEELRARLEAEGALVGQSDHSTTKSLYARDPDGLEFEVCWIVPAALLTEADLEGRDRIRPLNLRAEIARFGADTPGRR
jgi:catechol-2,3-dioxygenase